MLPDRKEKARGDGAPRAKRHTKGNDAVAKPTQNAAGTKDWGALSSLPDDFRTARQFLIWKYVEGRKVPHYADGTKRHGKQGGDADRDRLVPLDEAMAAATARGVDGVGWCALPGCEYFAVDLDDCLDEQGRLTKAELRPLVEDTYCEVSPSGRGLRLLFRGDAGVDGNPKNHAAGVELFADSGYVTLTGQAFGGKARPVATATDAVVSTLRSTTENVASERSGSAADGNIPSPLDAKRLRDVRAALAAIPPDCGYGDWIDVGMALHSGDPKPDGIGFRMWHQWSRRGEKYAETSEEEMAAKWRGFRPGGGLTLATLFGMAKERGWSPKAAPEPEDGELVLVSGNDIAIRNVRWLWPGRLPLGLLTLFAGEGGVGKGTAAADLVARATTGAPWPDDPLEERREPIEVIWFGVEDNPEEVVLPRCLAAGAVRERIQFVDGVKVEGGTVAFNLNDDLAKLEAALRRNPRVKLVVFDPITAYLQRRNGRGLDSHNAAELRGVLSPLSKLAADHGAAILGITHLTKDDRGFVHRVLGSGAWTQVARCNHVFVELPDPHADASSEKQYAMLDIKRNYSAPVNPLRYRIRKEVVDTGRPSDEVTETSRVEWQGEDPTLSLEQLRGGARGPLPTARVAAAAFLRGVLAAGPLPAEKVKWLAAEQGITENAIRNARKDVCEVHLDEKGKTVYALRKTHNDRKETK